METTTMETTTMETATVETATVETTATSCCKTRGRYAEHPKDYQHDHSYREDSIISHRNAPFPRQMIFAHLVQLVRRSEPHLSLHTNEELSITWNKSASFSCVKGKRLWPG
jgi:hypothetical protein